MKIKNTILIFTIITTILLLVGGAVLFLPLNSLSQNIVLINQSSNQVQKASKSDNLAQTIRYYDEVLTQSARNYAYSGDLVWKNRYFDTVPLLDNKINEVLKEADSEVVKIFQKINTSNLELVKLEEKALGLVDEQKKDEAIAILESENYQSQKKIYSDGLDEYIKLQSQVYNITLETSNQALKQTADKINNYLNNFKITIVLVIVLAFILSLSLFVFFKKRIINPLSSFESGIKEILNGNFEYTLNYQNRDEIGDIVLAFNEMVAKIKNSRLEIDQKVKEQTQEIINKSKDLDEQQQATLNILEDVNEAKAKQEALLLGIGDGVIATDSEGIITFINEVALSSLKLDKTKVTNTKIEKLVDVQDEKGKKIQPEKRPIYMCLKEGKKIHISRLLNYHYVRSDGTSFPVSITVSPVVQEGKVDGAIVVFRDVTHEKEVDRMKTEFISLASHQLRTPLSAMKWFAEMLLAGDAGKLTKDQIEYITNIYKSNERMIDLVNSLLNISRIESGRIIVDPTPTNLSELINEVVGELDNKIKAKKLSLVISVHKDLNNINIDPKLVREVYKNFMTNSIKYTQDGGEISILVSTKGEDVISQISDNGYGIPKDEQAKIFDKFYRGTNIIKSEPDGTGLGLYLVKAIVESSGGKVWFESDTDPKKHHSTFWFSLPKKGSTARKGEVTINS